ncbi:hypothetical protein E3N88_04032 [Mikania micrantha]|uniref:Uncharacterized protein n=1 Tax=Mikania micrantha TaxID=192012 RepID=A0A5N6PT89_9ASTR|nr:hypothetical protein E3N88_04032 [Mikania micrantha]
MLLCMWETHIARHCLHRPTEFFYGKNQKVTPKANPTSIPMRTHQSSKPMVKPQKKTQNHPTAKNTKPTQQNQSGHVNLKNPNRLAKGNHVIGFPSKDFSSMEKCIAFNVMSIRKNSYCLVITNDYSRFTWVLFHAKKDETRDPEKTPYAWTMVSRQYSAARTPQQTKLLKEGTERLSRLHGPWCLSQSYQSSSGLKLLTNLALFKTEHY